jgi:hypothetical protein
MIDVKQRKTVFAVLMLLTLFAACKGESPTAPTTTPSTPTNPTPPTGASVTLTVTNATPLVNSTSTITATVSENGQPVPNGTAVQFTTTLGAFTDVGSSGQTIIKTTTNGVATATLTAGAAGNAVVTATVNNVSRTTTIVFSTTTVPPVPNTSPTIISITPASGRPQGGETITIIGTNFRQPLRVIFTCVGSAANPPDPAVCAGQAPKDAFIQSVSATQIVAVTPSFSVPAGAAVTTSIQIIVGAGTPNEQSVTQASSFTFASPTLTPQITTIQPTSGPLAGGTRISIIGSGFQSPVQVTFGTGGGPGPLANQTEVQVVSVRYDEIIAVTPELRQIDPALGTNQVTVRVLNVASNQEVTANNIFRYADRARITAIDPGIIPAAGATMRIDGFGFDDPVSVNIAGTTCLPDTSPFGFTLQVIKVTGTQILARVPSTVSPCFCGTGTVTVTNVSSGDTTASPGTVGISPVSPEFVTVNPSTGTTPGSSVTVTIRNPGVGQLGTGDLRFGVGGTFVTPAPNPVTTGSGVQTFNLVLPPANSFNFQTQSCLTTFGTIGAQLAPTTVPLTLTNLTTGCTASFFGGIVVNPPTPNACNPPTATITQQPAQTCPVPNLNPASVSALAGTHSATLTITNAAVAPPLVILSPNIAQTNAIATVAPSGATIAPGGFATFTLTLDPTAAGADSATYTFNTNDPARPTIVVTVCGVATP